MMLNAQSARAIGLVDDIAETNQVVSLSKSVLNTFLVAHGL